MTTLTEYNHAFTFGFSLVNASEGGEATGPELRRAIMEHLARTDDNELMENCGAPFDSYELDG